MTKLLSIEWAAKLIECLAELPDDVEVHSFEIRMNLDTPPFHEILSIHLCKPVKHPAAVNGKRYSGWQEKRIYVKPDVFVWWSEDIDDGTST